MLFVFLLIFILFVFLNRWRCDEIVYIVCNVYNVIVGRRTRVEHHHSIVIIPITIIAIIPINVLLRFEFMAMVFVSMQKSFMIFSKASVIALTITIAVITLILQLYF